MKDLIQTSVDILPHIKPWTKILWKPFLESAVAAGAFLTSAFALLASHDTSDSDMVSFVFGDTLVQLAPLFIVALVLGLVSCILGVVFACKAHRKVCNILKDCGQKDFTRQRRSLLGVELSGLLLLLLAALLLPSLILMLSALQANRSSVLLDVTHTPSWPYVAIFMVSAAATVLLMTTATFTRACFRNLSRNNKAETVAEG